MSQASTTHDDVWPVRIDAECSNKMQIEDEHNRLWPECLQSLKSPIQLVFRSREPHQVAARGFRP